MRRAIARWAVTSAMVLGVVGLTPFASALARAEAAPKPNPFQGEYLWNGYIGVFISADGTISGGWYGILIAGRVHKNGSLTFTFNNGYEVTTVKATAVIDESG